MLYSTILFDLSLALFAQGDVTKEHDDRLTTAVILDTPTTGSSTTPEGRAFLKLARVDDTTGSQIVEVIGEVGEQKLVPYPNDVWNS
ncbi:hypothetical protein ACN42_g7954 [Penicillium freii]|uniref:Uncharacterized protein n=1 Tax=Penicillium freii TaxID=48697 RepID=A0A117NMF5_PENFR|nr:hypothetical protein ACN42_g7954 [Penicillium freii]